MPHIIRLNRVWELRLPDVAEVDAAAIDALVSGTQFHQRIDLPWTPVDLPTGKSVLLSRRFNRPSNLSADQTVHLAMEPAALGQVALNGERLEPSPGQAADGTTVFFSIADRLRDNNRLDLFTTDARSLTTASARLIIDEAR